MTLKKCRNISEQCSAKHDDTTHRRHTDWRDGSIPKRPIAKTAPKILISKKIVQNGPLHCPKRPIIQPKRPIAKSKTAHSYIQNGPLSLSQGCRGYGDSRGYGYGMGMGIKIQSPRQPCIIGIRQRPNFQSDLEILYVEASYTRVRGLDDSETVKCSDMTGVTSICKSG